MKKIVLLLTIIFASIMQGQEIKQIPMVNVTGEGKIKTTPDEACITISQETKGLTAVGVKKENDIKIDAILKFIKKMNIPQSDYLTQRVALNPIYDYEKKQQEYSASQTVSILLKDLSKYDILMDGLVKAGINKIDNIEFKTSKLLSIQSEARKLAIKNAKLKAEDFVSVLGQKIGKAFSISDNSQNFNPHPVMYASMKSEPMNDGGTSNETLAAGEIEVVVNVNVSFLLE